MMKVAVFSILFAACSEGDRTVVQAECMIPVRAWCEAQATCHARGFDLATCLDTGTVACSASEYVGGISDADPWQCGVLQRELECSAHGGTLDNPESASCLRSFWTW